MDCDEQMVGVVKAILSVVVQRATVAAAAAARSKVILQKKSSDNKRKQFQTGREETSQFSRRLTHFTSAQMYT